MREIKFRGLSDNFEPREWFYGCLVNQSDKHFIIHEDIENMVIVDPETVGQYTGLKDKNGKEIHEGDIIRTRETDADDWEIYLVKYFGEQDYPAFDTEPHIDCDSNGLSHAMACCEVEIIGNIHDNPDLSREGWPHAIGRAIKAEAEVERLQDENARLRRVAEAARGAYDYYDMVWDGGIAHELGQTLAELDKAKEGER